MIELPGGDELHAHLYAQAMLRSTDWSGSPAPEAPDDWWVDDETGEYVNAETGQRMARESALAILDQGGDRGRS